MSKPLDVETVLALGLGSTYKTQIHTIRNLSEEKLLRLCELATQAAHYGQESEAPVTLQHYHASQDEVLRRFGAETLDKIEAAVHRRS